MNPYLPIATWLACKRHVEENCKRKLRSLGISAEYCTAFLQGIFGSDANHEKGLIDSDGCKDFDAKLESLENVWNSREKKSRVQCSLIQAKQNFTITLWQTLQTT